MNENTFESKNTLLSENIPAQAESNYIIENESVSIDVSMLYRVSGNDAKFIHSTIHIFLKNMFETINKIEHSLKAQNWEDVSKYAHLAKSSLSIIKIKEMIDWVTQIELNARIQTNLNIISELIEKVKEKYLFAEVILNERF